MRSDTLHEALLLLVKTSPLAIARLLRGSSQARRSSSNALPNVPTALTGPTVFRDRSQGYLQGTSARPAGCPDTAAPTRIAEAVAAHLSLFDEVIASSDNVNLSRDRKAAALVRRYGRRAFQTMSATAVTISPCSIIAAAGSWFLPVDAFAARRPGEPGNDARRSGPGRTPRLVKALRLHQWLRPPGVRAAARVRQISRV